MLDEKGVSYTYREYTKDPLTEDEIREVLGQLGMSASDVLRARDAKKAGLTGDESDEQLVALMAENPRLLQRPILVTERGAALGRPVENLEAVL
ncbi:MAG: arsenate reductase (glutaredoxin) [Deltaproteobacteria bacterium]|nr:MAG: arsenate reductase (glutaredoxin) [Deltaproteobacteria bacterium]